MTFPCMKTTLMPERTSEEQAKYPYKVFFLCSKDPSKGALDATRVVLYGIRLLV